MKIAQTLSAPLLALLTSIGCSGATLEDFGMPPAAESDDEDPSTGPEADDDARTSDTPSGGGDDAGGDADASGDSSPSDDDDGGDDSSDSEDPVEPMGEVVLFEGFEGLDGTYAPGDLVGTWSVVAATEHALVSVAENEGITAHEGQHVFSFSALSVDAGFGDNRIDRCVAIDPARGLQFSYWVHATVSEVDDDLRVRLNPTFYPDMDDCQAEVGTRDGNFRLDGGRNNDDLDVRLGSAGVVAGIWSFMSTATDGDQEGPMIYAPEDFPEGTTVVRVSLRLRDHGFEADPTRRIYIDGLRVVQPD